MLNWILNRTGIYHMKFYESDKIQGDQLKLFQIWTNTEPKSNVYERITKICAFLDWNEKTWTIEFGYLSREVSNGYWVIRHANFKTSLSLQICRSERNVDVTEAAPSPAGCYLSLVHDSARAHTESGWKEIVSALTEARKLLPTFN